LNSIFDVDKMLCFVAPEWWRPRLHRSHLSLGSEGGSEGGVVVGSQEYLERKRSWTQPLRMRL